MLIYLLAQVPLIILDGISSFLPQVNTLPFGLDTILANGFGYFFYVMVYIPPLQTMYEAFLWVIGFKITLKVLLMVPFIGRMFNN